MAVILYPRAGRPPPLLSHHHTIALPHSASFFPPCGTAFTFGESVKDLANGSLSAEDVSAIWRIAMIIDDTFIEGGSGGGGQGISPLLRDASPDSANWRTAISCIYSFTGLFILFDLYKLITNSIDFLASSPVTIGSLLVFIASIKSKICFLCPSMPISVDDIIGTERIFLISLNLLLTHPLLSFTSHLTISSPSHIIVPFSP